MGQDGDRRLMKLVNARPRVRSSDKVVDIKWGDAHVQSR